MSTTIQKRPPSQKDIDAVWFAGLKHAEKCHQASIDAEHQDLVKVPDHLVLGLGVSYMQSLCDAYNSGIEDYQSHMEADHG